MDLILGKGVLTGFDGGAAQAAKLGYMLYATTLVAGTVTDNIGVQVNGAFVMVSRGVAGGVLGHLTAIYNPAPNVVVTSSNAGDTSTVFVLVIFNA